ncbi:hypothetical protein J7E45_11320 [Microbacterium sp. ISL-59]|uniref:hypothetical protein n=1 Tax=Microbacterium sp. ISL-59 TaxID=2819159 RepID=UPI001BEC5A94|nr:hypothetical protein [Microbacterium sp. ISL-59]MBT2496199.1 hypothetical protein [Microbacterium sp. ISL-59]
MTEAVFWSAVQVVGTVIAALVAITMLLIAGSEFRQLIESNKLFAEGTTGIAVFVVVRNDGRTPVPLPAVGRQLAPGV